MGEEMVLGTELFDPFPSAKVFLSHAWEDNDISDRLYEELAQAFQVLYDRRSLLEIGDTLLPREAITRCDFFLFLASQASMGTDSNSLTELKIADASRLRRRNRIGIVSVEGYEIPEAYRDTLFERCAERTFPQDARRIVGSIKRRLANLGGLIEKPYGFVAGREPQAIIDCLIDPRATGVYPFSVVFSKAAMERLITEIRKLSLHDLDVICANLVDMYLMDQRPVTRQNAIYLLGRLRAGEADYADEARTAYPSSAEHFLYRGFHVALGFLGDTQAMNDYVAQLATGRGKNWQKQRQVNARFHIVYYGGKEGAIAELRREVRTLQPINLLGLDVVTLGMMSHAGVDAEVLEQQRLSLVRWGVNAKLVDQARAAILARARTRTR